MDLGLKDKVVLVVGSGKGIGRATAEAFLNEGARVMATEANPIVMEQTRNLFKHFPSDRFFGFVGDMTQKKEIEKCVKSILEQWETIDIFIGNIGNGESKPVLQSDTEEWQKMLRVNLLGSVEAALQIVPIMQNKKTGNIIFTASIAGMEYIGAPAAYAAAKAALLSYAKSLAVALISDNIRVNAVSPGNILFTDGRWDKIIKESPHVLNDIIKKEVPMNRLGTVDEVASTIVFLASEKASFITGSCLVVDGGQRRSF